jgi:GDP-mannose 6-dehydrogenase
VNPDRLIGANREYLEKALPHIASLFSHDLEMTLKGADLVIVAQANPADSRVRELIPDRPVLDLSGAARPAIAADNYQGLSW